MNDYMDIRCNKQEDYEITFHTTDYNKGRLVFEICKSIVDNKSVKEIGEVLKKIERSLQ